MEWSKAQREGVWLLVDFYILADKVSEAEQLFEQHVKDGRQDRGNLVFTMLRDEKDPTRFTSLEAWQTREDIEHHDAQPHHPVFLRKLAQLQSKEKEVRFLSFFADGEAA